MPRAYLLVALALVACKSDAQKACEHARDVMVGNQRTGIESMIAAGNVPEEDAKSLRDELARTESAFLERCLALDEAGKACVARVDEINAAATQMRADFARCKAENRADANCVGTHVEPFEQRFAGCNEATASLFGKSATPAGDHAEPTDPDDPQAKAVAAMLTAADEACACKDMACLEAVQRELGDVAASMDVKHGGEKISEETKRKLEDATKRTTDCAMKLATPK